MHSYRLHGIYSLIEDGQEQCFEISYVMGKYTVALPCEHKEQTLTSNLEGLGNFLEELSFKQRPKERGQGRDGERSHGGKRENFIFLGATRGSFCNREEGH